MLRQREAARAHRFVDVHVDGPATAAEPLRMQRCRRVTVDVDQ